MPNFDKTGPDGKGPMTGRKMGNCSQKNNSTDNQNMPSGRMNGRGMGCGRRRQCSFREGFRKFCRRFSGNNQNNA